MYAKITIAITILFTAALFYLVNEYHVVGDFKFANPQDFVPYYEAAANQFLIAGFIFCIAIWIWVNVVAIKNKQLFWLWIPFLFTAFVAITLSYQQEDIFLYRKANGMWKGGFSLSYFFGIAIIIIAAVVILINFFVLKYIVKKTI